MAGPRSVGANVLYGPVCDWGVARFGFNVSSLTCVIASLLCSSGEHLALNRFWGIFISIKTVLLDLVTGLLCFIESLVRRKAV